MSNEDETQQQEFSRGSVPESASVSGFSVGLVLIGLVMSLPCFVVGAQLGTNYGLSLTIKAVAIGTAIITLIAAFTGAVGQRSRLTTAMIIQTAFGQIGAKIINLVLAVTILGWFGVITKLFGEAIANAAFTAGFGDIDPRIFMVAGGALIVVTTMLGFNAIQKVSKVITPFLIMGLVATAYLATRLISGTQLMATPLDAPHLGIGISMVVGTFAVGATIFPDFCRFARKPGDAVIATIISVVLGLPIAFILSAIPSIATGESELTIILTSLGLGLPALALIVCSSWTANAGTLYSSTLTVATIAPQISHMLLTAAAGTFGILLAIFGISDYLIPFLTLLGVAIPPIAGIYVADFFLVRRAAYLNFGSTPLPALRPLAVIAWIAGIAIGSATAKYLFVVTGVPALDSVLTAFAAYLALSKIPLGRNVTA